MTQQVPVSNYPYAAKTADAIRWLGNRYLLAKPVKLLPGLIRRQAG